jgi:hypothetical protein
MYIVEVGSGHGKLAFLVARELLAAREQWPDPAAAKPPFVLVVTDFTSASLPAWAEHPRLKPLLDAGVMDLACFGACCGPGAAALTALRISCVHPPDTL